MSNKITLHITITAPEDEDALAHAVELGDFIQNYANGYVLHRHWWVTDADDWQNHRVIPGREGEYIQFDGIPTTPIHRPDAARGFDAEQDDKPGLWLVCSRCKQRKQDVRVQVNPAAWELHLDAAEAPYCESCVDEMAKDI